MDNQQTDMEARHLEVSKEAGNPTVKDKVCIKSLMLKMCLDSIVTNFCTTTTNPGSFYAQSEGISTK